MDLIAGDAGNASVVAAHNARKGARERAGNNINLSLQKLEKVTVTVLRKGDVFAVKPCSCVYFPQDIGTHGGAKPAAWALKGQRLRRLVKGCDGSRSCVNVSPDVGRGCSVG